ncbi:MAG: cytosine permease [Pirellulales bacterium]|nr:cytosine permease [Pirellulales bacterium]
MASGLPDYIRAARPVPQSNRVAWYKSTAQTYAGIMLWFVFWQDIPAGGGTPGGTLAQGLGIAFCGLVLAGLLCHFFYYLAPGLFGLKTGLPLYIVGTSTYGATGGFLMPGFLMGVLQFGWLGVNAFFSAVLLCAPWVGGPDAAVGTPLHAVVATVWAVLAAFMGLKGIQYVARVASFLPLIPLAILLILFISTASGLGSFNALDLTGSARSAADNAQSSALSIWGVVAFLLTYIIGFFATAGAAGTDFGMNNRDAKDVQLGGLVGIAGATIFAGGLSLLIVAGAHGLGKLDDPTKLQTTALMANVMGKDIAPIFWYLLTIAAFPPACFSAFIAANSFKTTLPKVNPFISVGIGTLVSIVLAVTGWAGDVVSVFSIIGASFGPVCGAMAADYLLSGKRWAGPRAGFNPAGWLSWIAGFIVGAFNSVAAYIDPLKEYANLIPVPPLMAFVVGFVLYFLLAKIGLQSRTLEMPATTQEGAGV